MASVDIGVACILDNLSLATTKESLQRFFSQFGEIIATKFSEDLVTGTSKRCGYIFFKERSSVRHAVNEMNGKEFDGETITVKMAVEISDGFGSDYDTDNSFHPFAYSAHPRRFGYKPAPFGFGFNAAFPFGFSYDGDSLPFDYYGGSLPLGFCTGGYGCRSTVTDEVGFGCLVGNLALTTTDDSLAYVFSKFGEIIQSKVSKGVNGKLKAIVIFKERLSLRGAIDGMNGRELDGEKIVVAVAHASDPILYEARRCDCGFRIAPC